MKKMLPYLACTYFFQAFLFSTESKSQTIDSLEGFNEKKTVGHLVNEHQITAEKLPFYLDIAKRQYIQDKYTTQSTNQPHQEVQAACSNLDFETGDKSSWTVTGESKIVKTGNDWYGAFPLSCPGGNYSLRLGADTATNYATQSGTPPITSTASQTFAVSSSNAILTINYAMVLLNYPSHTTFDAGRVLIEVFDQNNKLINCATDTIYAIAGTKGLKTSAKPGICNWGFECYYDILYKPWTPITVDLSTYIGQNITLKITNKWCLYGPDWTYCYIDCSCSPLKITSTTPTCSSSSVQLCGPPNLQGYVWSGPGGATGQTTQCITTSASGKYTLKIPASGACPQPSVDTILTISTSTFTLAASSPVLKCYKASDGVATVTPNGGATPFSYLWSDGQTGATAINLPAGTFGVTVTDAGGCTGSTTITITEPPPLQLLATGTNAGCTCTGQITSSASGGTPGYSFSWSNGTNTGNLSSLCKGSYTLILSDANGCTRDTAITLSGGAGSTAAFSTADVCLNNVTQFTDNSTGANGWSWNFGEPSSGTNNSSTSQNATHTYGAAGTYKIWLVTSSTTGCKDSIDKDVIVNPLPIADYVAPGVCIGTAVNFTNNSNITGTGSITNSSWNFGEASSGPNNVSSSVNPSHVYSTSGNFNVLLTVTSDKGCQSTKNASVKVNPKPTAAFATVNACANTPVTFTDGSNSTAGAVSTWDWDYGDNSVHGTTQNAAHTYAASGTNTVTLIITTADGCKDTITNPAVTYPSAVPAFVSPDVCLKLASTFTDQSAVSAPSTVSGWSWNFGDASAAVTTQNPSHTYLNPGTYNVILTTTTSDNCTSTLMQPVIVHPLPVAAFNTISVCKGAPSNLTDNSAVSSGTINNWKWDFGDGSSSSTIQNPQHTYPAYGTFSISLVVTSDKGCKDSIKQNVKVSPLPQALFVSKDTSGCEVKCVDFTDGSLVTAGTITNWLWDFGDGMTSTLQSPNKCYASGGKYNVKLVVTSDQGCRDSLVKISTITVFPKPVADFTTTPSAVTILSPTVNYGDASSSDVISWYWYFGDGDSLNPSTASPSHQFVTEDSKKYTTQLIVTNQFGCKDTVSHDIVIGADWAFYIPNAFSPNADGVNDDFNGKGVNIKKYEMIIFDRWGNLIYKTTSLNTAWDGRANGGELTTQQDVFVWKVVLTDVFDVKHQYTGHVTMVR